jgi:hypothetical protein
MRILVTGGRNYLDRDAVFRSLDAVHAKHAITLIIHGACSERKRKTKLTGADLWAQQWAEENEIPYLGVPAKWTGHGLAAGPIRNGCMLVKWKPDAIVAFPGGSGTTDMVTKGKAAGVPVWEPMKEKTEA